MYSLAMNAQPKIFSSIIHYFIFYLCIWTLMLAGSNTSFINRWKEFPCVILIFKINQFILKIRDQRWVEIRVFTEFWIFVKGVYSVSTWTIIKRNLLFHGERGKVIFKLKLHVITKALESLCCTYPDFWSKWSSHVMFAI